MNDIIKASDEKALYESLRNLEIKSYQASDLNQYLDFLESSGYGLADGLTPYIEQLKTDGWIDRNKKKRSYKAASIRIKADAAKRLGDYVIDKHPEAFTPAAQLQWEKEKRKAKAPKTVKVISEDKYLPWPEVLDLIDKTEDPKIRLIMAFLAQSACRINEALNVKLDDMVRNHVDYHITIIGKGAGGMDQSGGKERKVFVQIPVIEEIISVFGSKKWLFEHAGKRYNNNSVTTRIHDAGRLALGKNISAHIFRHSWATEQRNRGRGLDEISKYLGHASLSVTADIYSHVGLSSGDAMLPVFTDPDPDEEKKVTAALNQALQNVNVEAAEVRRKRK
jgi:integrase